LAKPQPADCHLFRARVNTLIESLRGVMPSEEAEAGKVMASQFKEEGITLFTKCATNSITYEGGKFLICIEEEGNHHDIEAENLLVSTGRSPNVEALSLEKAGVKFSEKGIQVDPYGRTNQKHIYAIGDCIGAPFFTHLAEHHGRAVLTSLLLPFKKKILTQPVLPSLKNLFGRKKP
jgi:pyruvate/2-oxoglutarate dehydrogenase complex dihydrolipoamide dehydrogenase (E3) component